MEAEVSNKVADFLEHIINLRDPYEDHHSREVSELVERLCKEDGIESEELEMIVIGARLHDIGKLLIPEVLLNKTGRLTRQDWEIIHAHPRYGVEMLEKLEISPDILDIVLHHHENLDGSGYPDGLRSKQISRGVKIIRICDTYQSLMGNRPYKSRMTSSEAFEEMEKKVGTYYDPILFSVFKKNDL